MKRSWVSVALFLSLASFTANAVTDGTAAAPGVPIFQLPDQRGRLVEVAPSGRNTLIVFYRGDW